MKIKRIRWQHEKYTDTKGEDTYSWYGYVGTLPICNVTWDVVGRKKVFYAEFGGVELDGDTIGDGQHGYDLSSLSAAKESCQEVLESLIEDAIILTRVKKKT